jgi:hypothetical protein
MKLLSNILKEKNKISQGRFYLFLSILVYYITQGVILIVGIFKFDVDKELLASVASAIEYPMTTFATYTLGGKVVEVFKNKNKT